MSPRAWYREPMLWLVIGLPAASVVAGLTLLAIAIGAGGADAVPESVRRMAQVQLADFEADRNADLHRLQAVLRRESDTGALILRLTGGDRAFSAPARLRLRLIHPTRGERDRELTLTASGDTWLGRLDASAEPAQDWLLVLVPHQHAGPDWRLHGRLDAHASEARLAPRLHDDG